jgi:hypothetical protein
MKSLPLVFAVLYLMCAPPARAARIELMEYDVTWVGLSVGTMIVRNETDAAGRNLRALRIRSRPWISALYPVDTTVACVIEESPEGPRHTVSKKVVEKDFKQDDTLVLLPDSGIAVWSNAINHKVRTSIVPKGSRDLVSFFFDLRDATTGGPLKANGDYQLVMDGAIHALEIKTGPAQPIRTAHGRVEAIPVQALSRSPTLFSRNRPRSVWIAASRPVVLFADIQIPFGAVRATLVKWTIDGQAVEW